MRSVVVMPCAIESTAVVADEWSLAAGVQAVAMISSGMKIGRSCRSLSSVAAQPFVTVTLGSVRLLLVPRRVPYRVLCEEFRNWSGIPW